MHPHLDPLADQPAAHRVRVPLDADRAAAADRHHQPRTSLPATRRQRAEHAAFLGQAGAAAGVPLRQHALKEPGVLLPVGELPAAPQQERLIDGVLEPAVLGLDVAVLMRLPGLDPLPLHPVVREQRLVPPRELRLAVEIVDRCTEPVRAVTLRHPAQLPQRVLEPLAQTGEALRVANRRRLPVRVRQHKVIHQVLEQFPADQNAQARHVREVRSRQPPRLVPLPEVHLLGRPNGRPPLLDPTLKRPQLPVLEPPRVLPLEPLEERLGPQPRGLLQQRTDLRPDVVKRVRPGPPRPRLAALAELAG